MCSVLATSCSKSELSNFSRTEWGGKNSRRGDENGESWEKRETFYLGSEKELHFRMISGFAL
jgi:hypothetical protein